VFKGLTLSQFFSSELPNDHVQNSIASNRKHYGWNIRI